MFDKELLQDGSLPLTLAQAVERNDYAVLILLFVAFPVAITMFCAALETVLAKLFFHKNSLRRILRATLAANMLGVATLFLGCIAIFALLTYLNTIRATPLWLVILYLAPILVALRLKTTALRLRLQYATSLRLNIMLTLSHLLAIAAFYHSYQRYILDAAA